MGTFTSSKTFIAAQDFIPYACSKIKEVFEADGFEYAVKSESFEKTVITVTKGNLVKQVVGLKQGLEISFSQSSGEVFAEAKGTVIKDQAIASAITLLVTWPVAIAQIIGMIKQSKLDEKAIGVIDNAYSDYNNSERPVFCTNCGHMVNGENGRCPNCGNSL